MKAYVGTSGWAYPMWNPDGLDWYVKNSGLNAIELNMSFYRYPYPNQVKGWSRRGRGLRWAIKVNRLITHVYKFNDTALVRWKSFKRLFKPMEEAGLIDFYLFQLPPSNKPTPVSKKRLERFFKKVLKNEGSNKRFALECRHQEWFTDEHVEWIKGLGLTMVSVDAPGLPRDMLNTSKLLYLRMHGRTAWYSHCYSQKELKEVVENILRVRPKPKDVYVFFNNNHAMLKNARSMLTLVRSKLEMRK